MATLVQRQGKWMLEVEVPAPMPGHPLHGKWVPYIARIVGLDPKYGMARTFVGVRHASTQYQYATADVTGWKRDLVEVRTLDGTSYWEFQPAMPHPTTPGTTTPQLVPRSVPYALAWAKAKDPSHQHVQQAINTTIDQWKEAPFILTDEPDIGPTSKKRPPVPTTAPLPSATSTKLTRQIDLGRVE